MHGSFDFSQFDPIASQLDLVIGTPQVLELPIRSPPREVARPIDSVADLRREWIRQESLSGQVRPLPVTSGNSRAANP